MQNIWRDEKRKGGVILNVNKKYIYIFLGSLIVLCCLVFFGGFNTGRRRGDTEIAEAQLIVDRLGETITGLNETARLTDIENKRLTAIYEQDRETISDLERTNKELEDANKEVARLLSEQGRIVKELAEGNREIRDSSSSIGDGLGRAIEEVEGIIADIQARED